jgi:hypothetical protein
VTRTVLGTLFTPGVPDANGDGIACAPEIDFPIPIKLGDVVVGQLTGFKNLPAREPFTYASVADAGRRAAVGGKVWLDGVVIGKRTDKNHVELWNRQAIRDLGDMLVRLPQDENVEWP